jgi:hypothetical protein
MDDKKPPAPSVQRRRSQRDDVRAQIAGELYTTLEQLSADPELLSVVGSWRDTLDDDEILEHLKSLLPAVKKHTEDGDIFFG